MKKISAVISAYNEEKNIKECLVSVAWADEIIVVDGKSSDKTAEIAKKCGARVFITDNNLMLNINKNYGFGEANNEWILNLDADERVSVDLREEIRKTINKESSHNGYRLPRQNIIFGKWIQHGLWWPDFQIRLFKKDKGKFPCEHVHEYLEVEGSVGELSNPFIHYNYSSVSQFLHKLDTVYTENEVENFVKSGKNIFWQDALKWPIRDFLKIYFFQKGYKDGLHGLVLALLQAFYALLVFTKIWERQGFKEREIKINDLRDIKKLMTHEINYWFIETAINETNNVFKKIIFKIKKRFIGAVLE